MESLAITRCALLTPLDDASGGTWEALCAGRRVEERHTVSDELMDRGPGLDRSIRLALTVGRQVLDGRGGGDTSLFCGTSKGPIETMLAACDRARRGEALHEVEAQQVALGAGAMGAIVRQRLGMAGPAHTSVAACSSGLHALHRAAAALRRGECRRALVVAADASLHPLFTASFDRLGVLAKENAQGIRRCEPFGEAGEGFFLVEAAAAVMLEAADSVHERTPIAWLEQSWIGADSTDLIAIDPATRTLRRGLQAVSGSSAPAFIHAHATGTAHDAYELAAIRSVFAGAVPVLSHKKWLGHSLGAAGLVSVVISAMCHHHGCIPEGHAVAAGAQSLTIAQGFGGHVGIVRLRGA